MPFSSRTVQTLLASLALVGASIAAEPEPEPEAAVDPMLQLAATSGCLACHSINPEPVDPDEVLPVGPAWRAVATRYQGDSQAHTKLVEIVKIGSNPYNRHWQGNVSGLAMPPNVALKDEDAEKLIAWILDLEPLDQ
ncbi:MAG: c-type cytochrome [Candidatus Competibacterales bacterium]